MPRPMTAPQDWAQHAGSDVEAGATTDEEATRPTKKAAVIRRNVNKDALMHTFLHL